MVLFVENHFYRKIWAGKLSTAAATHPRFVGNRSCANSDIRNCRLFVVKWASRLFLSDFRDERLSTIETLLTVRYPRVIHIIHNCADLGQAALPEFVDFSENLTVYYMVGLPEKG